MEIDARSKVGINAVRFSDLLTLELSADNPKLLVMKNDVNGKSLPLCHIDDVSALIKALQIGLKLWKE
jgi:hypothetical protein